MSFDSRLIHEVAVERSTAGPPDEWNNPTQVFATLATVPARITTKGGRELAHEIGFVASCSGASLHHLELDATRVW